MSRQLRFVLFLFVLLCVGQSVGQTAPAPESPQPPESQSPDSDFGEARRLSQQGKFDEAITALQRLGDRNPTRKGLAHELGLAYYKKGDYLRAAGYLKTAQAEDPRDTESIQLLGLSYYLAGRPAEAIPHLREDVKDAFSMALLVKAYEQTGDQSMAATERNQLANLNLPTIDGAIVTAGLRSAEAAH